jgi:hypothetical protein
MQAGASLAPYAWDYAFCSLAVPSPEPHFVVAGDSEGNVFLSRLENLHRTPIEDDWRK